ncbi:hypothetical protein [Pseudomonas sp. NFX98]|uniref:hypothetical protein n=1 Tax=Pseudomonas sp. NFX98 TaxID=3399122 RepID=UPI0039FC4710
MAAINTADRDLWETFASDSNFKKVRDARVVNAEKMKELKGSFENFRQGRRILSTESATELRGKLLHMLQLQHAVAVECETLGPAFEIVKAKIQSEFDTQVEMAYMAQVNDWLRLIERGTTNALGL